MWYEVASVTDTGREMEWNKWTKHGKFRSKQAAIDAANLQPIRAVVTPTNCSEVLHDNGKPHGGNPRWHRKCPCPLCTN